jgi:transcription antitermination factor NusG
MGVCSTVQLQQVPFSTGDSSAAEPFLPARQAPLPNWYAVFTMANHEKRAVARCEQRQVECFLPLYKTRRKWKNRCTVDLELPLFPNYFFARINSRDRVRVLEMPGVISIVSSGHTPLPLEDSYVNALRDGILAHNIEPHANLEAGELVRITSGPLSGAEGILERRKNDLRVILRLDMLARSVSVEVAAMQIEKACERQLHRERSNRL